MMLPLAETEAADIAADVIRLPPVMLPDTDTVVPVCVVALTLAPPSMLPPVMLPDTDTVVPVWFVALMLPPVMLPTALIPPLDVNTLAELLYNQVIKGLPIGPISIPPPSAAAPLMALLA